MKYLLLLPVLFLLTGCATGTSQTKQSLTIEIVKPSHDALAAFQDTEEALFAGGTLPMLTPAAHQRISAALAVAFRSHAVATRAVRTWQPGQPVPIDVTQLQTDVLSLNALLTQLAIPANTPVVMEAHKIVDTVDSLVARLRNP